jgi:hypothetical protein
MFREGVQTAEAIVFLQRALLENKVDARTAGRIKALLDDRARHYLRTRVRPGWEANWWALQSSAWQARDDELFALAAELGK